MSKPNSHEVSLSDGTLVLYSYTTPVAIAKPCGRKVRTNTRFSLTTERHISNFGAANWDRVPQIVIESMAKE
jgi:hypothetical protein